MLPYPYNAPNFGTVLEGAKPMIGKLAHRVTSHVVAILRANGGAATVELAILIPLLLMMLVGTVDFGLVIHEKMRLAHAARAGAQYALVRGLMDQVDLTQIETGVLDTLPADGNQTRTVTAALFCECPDESAVACDGTGICPDNGMWNLYLSVTVQEDFETLFDYPGIGQSFALSNNATIRLD